MRNKKVIVLSGYARGGTNIAWNLLQSHPEVCSPMYETGQLFRWSWILFICRLFLGYPRFCRRMIDAELHRYKMMNLNHMDNKYIKEEKLYTAQQIESAAVCLKSVNYDILLTEILLKVYPELYFIALTRNGYALTDGYVRRGKSVAYAARLYNRIGKRMRIYADSLSRFKMIKFEDVLQHPFKMAEDLFEFVDVYPHRLEKLRLKSKKILNKHNEHKTAFGNEHRKYWFDRESIGNIIDPNVNTHQVNRLTKEMIGEFNHLAGSALHFFGYEKL